MAIRIRVIEGEVVALCAAKTLAREGDIYLGDAEHYALACKFARDHLGHRIDWSDIHHDVLAKKTDMSRTPLLEIDWFKRSGVLAIADVVYVEGLGICSHQPDDSSDGHGMMDVSGDIHIVSSERLFLASREEAMGYWDSVRLMSERAKLETIAAIQHEIWSHWMKYLFSQCVRLTEDGVTIPRDLANRWMFQMGAPYSELSEEEKESDRDQARKVLEVL